MAELFLADDTVRRQRVVLKRILPYLTSDPEFLRMFLDEARIAAQLHHPHIIETYELGQLEGQIFLSMEYVDGLDLRKLMEEHRARRGGPLPIRIAIGILARIAAALGNAHEAFGVDGKPLEIIHRDVSPQNVMVGFDGQVKLVDFGIAKASAAMALSKPGVIKGKFLYLSPEQLAPERLDTRSDLFAFGSMIYEVTTGVSPFHRNTTEAIIYAIKMEEPRPLTEVMAGYPERLARIVARCLRKEREDRYQRGADIQWDLEAFLASHGGLVSDAELAAFVQGLMAEDEERTSLAIEPVAPLEQPESALPTPQVELPDPSEGLPPDFEGARGASDEDEDEQTMVALSADLHRALSSESLPAVRIAPATSAPPVRRHTLELPAGLQPIPEGTEPEGHRFPHEGRMTPRGRSALVPPPVQRAASHPELRASRLPPPVPSPVPAADGLRSGSPIPSATLRAPARRSPSVDAPWSEPPVLLPVAPGDEEHTGRAIPVGLQGGDPEALGAFEAPGEFENPDEPPTGRTELGSLDFDGPQDRTDASSMAAALDPEDLTGPIAPVRASREITGPIAGAPVDLEIEAPAERVRARGGSPRGGPGAPGRSRPWEAHAAWDDAPETGTGASLDDDDFDRGDARYLDDPSDGFEEDRDGEDHEETAARVAPKRPGPSFLVKLVRMLLVLVLLGVAATGCLWLFRPDLLAVLLGASEASVPPPGASRPIDEARADAQPRPSAAGAAPETPALGDPAGLGMESDPHGRDAERDAIDAGLETGAAVADESGGDEGGQGGSDGEGQGPERTAIGAEEPDPTLAAADPTLPTDARNEPSAPTGTETAATDAAAMQEPPPASSLAGAGSPTRLARVRLRAPSGTRVVTAGGQVLDTDAPIHLAAGPLELRLHCPKRRRPYSHWLRIAPDQAALQTFELQCEHKPLK